jgi:hypothetical protein
LKPSNTYNKPFSETTYLGENVINLLQQEETKMSQFLRATKKPPKVAQFAKKSHNLVTLIGMPACLVLVEFFHNNIEAKLLFRSP